ncbi:MAG: cytochrome d ubiquinol oxidase subunit II [Candidatus Micrarchaeota archaeon]|nr:cytochrome d ubiquinol oxidase subunit II [Candidatus Micrarchaeota archaeon]
MNILYLINYLILSVFATLFIVEVGIALLSLLKYRNYRDEIRKFLLPIWEVNGTFAAFYLVNFEVTYPTLLNAVGQLYVAPLLIAAIFFILRSIFLVYSEYMNSPQKENLYMDIYALSTLALTLIAISVFDSGISGIGVSLQANLADFLVLLFNPFNVLMLIGVFLIAIFVVSSCFKVGRMHEFGILPLALAFVLMGIAIWAYLPLVFANLAANAYLLAFPAILGIIAAIMQRNMSRYANHLTLFWLFVSINVFGAIEYPYVFGDINILNYVAAPAISSAILWISTIGGGLLIIALSYLIYLSYLKRENASY